MKTKLLLLCLLFISVSGLQAQVTNVNMTMGAGYSNQVYYKLSTETSTTFAANSWDIAFLRTSAFSHGIRVNGGIGIEVFQAAAAASDWNTINIANEASWTQLYNSDTDWNNGAFMQGTASSGWGNYNPVNHHIVGSIIYVLKYADGSYKKFICEDYFGAYTIKYSSWNGTSWDADQTAVISNSSNPNNKFNYYSLQTNQEVVAEPAIADWDIKFTRYYTEVAPNTQYLVTGVLHSDQVTVAENDEPGGNGDTSSLSFSTDINVIGYDWKSFTGMGFSVNTDKAYYIKYADNSYYRLTFSSFSGSSSGDLSFAFEDVTSILSVEDVAEGVSFGMYPNPSRDKKVNLLYDIQKLNSDKNTVTIYTTTGQQVFTKELKQNSGLYNKTLDLSGLKSGMYVVQFTSGTASVTKKLVLQ